MLISIHSVLHQMYLNQQRAVPAREAEHSEVGQSGFARQGTKLLRRISFHAQFVELVSFPTLIIKSNSARSH